ncbi:MAG: P-type conjugative transfer protein TrbL [Acidithiobacillus sp.]|nr:P-type conjugative transfer protein TrbL [Acidithiobacillus sp.]
MKKHARHLWLLFPLLLLFVPDLAFATTSGTSTIMKAFAGAASNWYSTLLGIAKGIFYVLFGLDFVYLVTQWLIGGKDVHEIFTSFIKKLMTIGVFYTILINANFLIGGVINGFQNAGIQAEGKPHLGIPWILDTGLNILITCVEGPISSASKGGAVKFLWDTVTSDGTTVISTVIGALVGMVVGIIAILALIYLALEYIGVQLEATFVASIGVIMLGFSGSRWTVQHAEGYLKYALSVGVRYLVLTIYIAFVELSAPNIINNLLAGVKQAGGTNILTTLDAYGDVLIFVILIAWLAKKLPSIAASVMSGSSSLSGGDLVGAAAAAGAVAAAAVATGGAAAVGALGSLGGGAGGLMTGAQAASAAGGAGGAGGAGAGGGAAAGSLPGAGGMGSGAGGAFPGAEHAVQAPDPSTIRSMREDHAVQAPVVGGGSQGAAPRATPTAAPASSSAGKSAGGATGGSGSGAGGSGSVDSAEGGADSGAATGAESSAEAGGGSAGSTGADAVEADAGGAAAETPAEAVDAGAGQGATQTASGAPQQKRPLPSATEAQANLVQAFHEALRPMNETMQKVNDTLAEGQQKKPKPLLDRLSEYQKGHQVAETLLSPGQAEKTGVQASSLGLKHSE